MSRANKTGRSRAGPPFVQLHNFMLDCPAWQELSAQERAVYVVLARRYNGSNNGFIGLGARAAAVAANISKGTAARALGRLEELGFIDCTTPSSFRTNACRQAEWRLTMYRCDRSGAKPTKRFMAHRSAAKASIKLGTVPGQTKDSGERKCA